MLTQIEIRDKLVKQFSIGELITLCYDIGIDGESIPKQDLGKEVFAQEVVAYCDRRNGIPNLIQACNHRRPEGDWITDIQVRDETQLSIASTPIHVEQVNLNPIPLNQTNQFPYVQIIIGGELPDFDIPNRLKLKTIVATFLGVPIEVVRLGSVESGSIKVLIEILSKNVDLSHLLKLQGKSWNLEYRSGDASDKTDNRQENLNRAAKNSANKQPLQTESNIPSPYSGPSSLREKPISLSAELRKKLAVTSIGVGLVNLVLITLLVIGGITLNSSAAITGSLLTLIVIFIAIAVAVLTGVIGLAYPLLRLRSEEVVIPDGHVAVIYEEQRLLRFERNARFTYIPSKGQAFKLIDLRERSYDIQRRFTTADNTVVDLQIRVRALIFDLETYVNKVENTKEFIASSIAGVVTSEFAKRDFMRVMHDIEIVVDRLKIELSSRFRQYGIELVSAEVELIQTNQDIMYAHNLATQLTVFDSAINRMSDRTIDYLKSEGLLNQLLNRRSAESKNLDE